MFCPGWYWTALSFAEVLFSFHVCCSPFNLRGKNRSVFHSFKSTWRLHKLQVEPTFPLKQSTITLALGLWRQVVSWLHHVFSVTLRSNLRPVVSLRHRQAGHVVGISQNQQHTTQSCVYARRTGVFTLTLCTVSLLTYLRWRSFWNTVFVCRNMILSAAKLFNYVYSHNV